MRKSRFTESQIIAILKQVESGRTGQEVCREHGISEQTLYRWKKKYGGMEASDAKRLRELEDENRKLKRIVADQAVDLVALKDVLGRKW
jgi:putative transposase